VPGIITEYWKEAFGKNSIPERCFAASAEGMFISMFCYVGLKVMSIDPVRKFIQ
jgi:hypothetical protein